MELSERQMTNTAAASGEKSPDPHDGGGAHRCSYLETIMHLFKGNVGPGLFAMSFAFRNAGILVAPFLTFTIGVVCVHCQHILVTKSREMQEFTGRADGPDFAETVELCFARSPKFSKWSKVIRFLVQIFLCVTQLGFCCVYFVFIGSNLKQIFDYYDIFIDVHIHMLMVFVPILLPSLLTNLKYLSPCSAIANILMIVGIAITMYFACQDLPSVSDRKLVAPIGDLPIFFGTAIFAFEGISLVLPLKNSMKRPEQFDNLWGVLNVGMTFVIFIFIGFGMIGYLKYGEAVEGSITLNLPANHIAAQFVKAAISLGVLLGYALQFFIAIQIMWPTVRDKLNITKHTLAGELVFRTVMVLITFGIAELVPRLGLFISLIGALCSTALALVFPPVIDLVTNWDGAKPRGCMRIAKNVAILIVALLGFATGTWESLSAIVTGFLDDT